MPLSEAMRDKATRLLPVIAQQYAIILSVGSDDLLEAWRSGLSDGAAKPDNGEDAGTGGGAGEARSATAASETEDADPDPVHDAPAKPGRKGTLKRQVIAVNKAHPDWTTRQIADHLGKRPSSVDRIVRDQNLRVASGRKGARRASVRSTAPARQKTVQPVARPLPPLFRLVNENGRYLHHNLSLMGEDKLLFTRDPVHAWRGSAVAIQTLHERLPATGALQQVAAE